jgi:hypothetical protein
MSDSLRTQELLAQEGLESIGQKLFNTINDLTGKPESARRWIWELLQNAKDVIDGEGKIEINLTEEFVEFSHNGAPFLHDHLLAILSQRSTKPPSYSDEVKKTFFEKLFSDEEIGADEAKKFLDTTGKFGTGFMTTYLLSKKISLESLYRSNGTVTTFKLPLDRKASTPDEMKEKVKESFLTFTELEKGQLVNTVLTDYKDGLSCDTKFIYNFDADGKTVAECGIHDMHNSLPFVFCFVPRLKSVSIKEYGAETIYQRLEAKSIDGLQIERIEKQIHDDKQIIEIAMLSVKYGALAIAIPVEHVEGNTFRIKCPNEATPRQFISFPLVGSESFPFPVIIHSPLFSQDDLRSRVFLNVTNHKDFDKKVALNRSLFEKAIGLYKHLLKVASDNKWEDVHLLAKSDLPPNMTDDWYKESIQKEIRKEVLDAEMVVTEQGNRIRPRDSKFPIHRENKLEEFWGLCKYLFGDKIPRRQDIEVWKKIIEANGNDWLGIEFDLTLEKLLLIIQETQFFSTFNETYFKNETAAFEALNKIIRFTEDEDKELLNRKGKPLSIFPNKAPNSPFTEKIRLSRDVGVPKELKDVLKTIGDDWYGKLVRDEVTVFEKESRLTVKLVSDKIREKLENYYANKLTPDEKLQLDNGLFELAGFATAANKAEIETLHKFLKQYFTDVSETVQEIRAADDFDWKPFQNWAVKKILNKVSSFSTLSNLSFHLFSKNYPEIKDSYSEDEENLMFKVDTALNELIQFVIKFDHSLLSTYSIIPNQLNQLCKYGSQIFNDNSIPNELKKIMTSFGSECRGSLLHRGVSLTLPGEPRDLKWICGQLDDIAMKEQDNPDLRQPIRNLDKWISQNKGPIGGMDKFFKTFYQKRSGIVLNTYSLEERNQFDEIQQSGLGSEFAAMLKTGATSDKIKEVTTLLQSDPDFDFAKVEEIKKILHQYPDLTSEKIDQLVELSKGWNPELTYSPDDEQKRRNFENGWKGEAFVYKDLLRKSFDVEWRNKSQTDNGNYILDFEGEKHFISDRFDKYDLIAKNANGKTFYIQVKATVTGISDADQIAIPISIREWNFVFETKDNDAYYLARVFNVNSNPVVYFMRLEKPEEL